MRRLREEQGIALVMALGVLIVISILTISLLTYSSDNLRGVRYGNSRVTAYSLAEAGVNEALAVLNKPTNNPVDSSLLPSTTSTYETGTATWSGTFDQPTSTWTLRSTGTVANPTGAAAVSKTLTVRAGVAPTARQPLNNQAWNYIYAYKANDNLYGADGVPTTCEMTINNSGNVATSVHVEGDLCLSNTTAIAQGPNGTKVVVKGRLYLANANQNWVGTSSSRVSEVYVGNGCKLQNNAVSASPCSTADNVFASQYDTSAPNLGAAPVPDWDGWYSAASPGPRFPCVASKSSASSTWPTFDGPDLARNNSVTPAWNLTPTTAYDCWTPGGELAWNPTTKVLTVNGTTFVDGSAYISNGLVNSYTGMGSLYLSGVFLLKNSKLCAVVVADGSSCDTNWDPNSRALFVVANGAGDSTLNVASTDSVWIKSAYFQGGIYGTNAVNIDTTSTVDGPMVGSTVTPGQSTSTSFPVISFVPTGTPGNQIVYSQVQPPTGYDG